MCADIILRFLEIRKTVSYTLENRNKSNLHNYLLPVIYLKPLFLNCVHIARQ